MPDQPPAAPSPAAARVLSDDEIAELRAFHEPEYARPDRCWEDAEVLPCRFLSLLATLDAAVQRAADAERSLFETRIANAEVALLLIEERTERQVALAAARQAREMASDLLAVERDARKLAMQERDEMIDAFAIADQARERAEQHDAETLVLLQSALSKVESQKRLTERAERAEAALATEREMQRLLSESLAAERSNRDQREAALERSVTQLRAAAPSSSRAAPHEQQTEGQ